MAKEYLFYKNTLILFLFIVVLSYFYYIPHFWLIGSDEAIYLASANSLISAEYTFNRLPNLFYYPGTSSVIAIIKLICGNSPLILNIVFTTISVVTLFLIYKTFNKNTLASLITIAIFSVNNQFIKYIYYIRSDILFVFLVYLTFVLWKKFLKDEETSILIVITVVAAFSALVRLEGLFICGTLFLSFSHFFYHKNKHLRTVRPLLIFGVSLTPFILWTWRNYLAYTKDAYNMALNFFFGLSGPRQYAPETHNLILDSDWLYPALRLAKIIESYCLSFLGDNIYLAIYKPNVFLIIAMIIFSVVSLYLGFKLWVKQTNFFEFIFFISLSIFLFIHSIVSYGNFSSVTVIPRYWLSVLPFLVYMWVLGTHTIIKSIVALFPALEFSYFNRNRITHIICFLLLSIPCVTGFQRLQAFGNKEWQQSWEEKNQAAAEIKEFAELNIPYKASIMATDIGYTAYMTNRKTVTLLASDNLTFKRILKHEVEYLVLFFSSQAGITPYFPYSYKNHHLFSYSQDLIEKYPGVFKKLLSPKHKFPENFFEIYKIDISALNNKKFI